MNRINQNMSSTKTINAEEIGSNNLRNILNNYQVNKLSSGALAFNYWIDIFLKQTNVYGNVYFSNHFEWHGILREAWFSKCVFNNMLEIEGYFVTKEAFTNYVSESYPFQRIRGQLSLSKLKQASVIIDFKFCNAETNNVISTGFQKILFTDKEHEIAKFPHKVHKILETFNVA